MTDTLHLTYSWQDIPVAKLHARLTNRFYGPLRWIVLILALTVLFSTFTLLSARVFPGETQGQLPTILAALACAVTLGVGNTLGHKRLQAALLEAPIRQKDCSLAINAYGIAAAGGALHSSADWTDVTEVVELGSFVLIMLSPLEYIPIPDFALPPDMTRADLVVQLRQWHADARANYSDTALV